MYTKQKHFSISLFSPEKETNANFWYLLELFVNFARKPTSCEAVAKDDWVESCDNGRIITAEF